MRLLFIIFLFCGVTCYSQDDKVILKTGQKKQGKVVSMGNDFIYFRDSSSNMIKISKADILLVEKYDGKVFLFGKKILEDTSSKKTKVYHHSFGLQPFNILLGRITGSYEYLNKSGNVGVMIPLSVTFDPVGVIYNQAQDSSSQSTDQHLDGVNFIGGADINFYIGKNDFEGLYVGPRIRYGVDMFLRNIEAYSVQTQIGWRLNDPEDRITQHLSVGFGFARILSSAAGNRISPKQSYAWGSINYRIGFNW